MWWKISETSIAKDESVINIANMFDEQIMIGQYLLEVD
jgi:hypothetical protein